MIAEYKDYVMRDGTSCVQFDIKTDKGCAHGIFSKQTIWVHAIWGEGSVKGLMNVLVNRFKSKRVVFSPLINDNLKNVVRGVVKVCRADDVTNPYHEDFEYLECEWET